MRPDHSSRRSGGAALETRREAHREEGSAYIITLLILFVLTALGLTLTLVTSTESTMGGQERTIQRTFYAADSGLSLAISSLMGSNDCNARCVEIADDTSTLFNSNELVDSIELTKTTALSDRNSNLSQINDNDYRSINHYVASRSTRQIPGADAIPIAQRTVSQMFSLDPWQTPLQCYTPIFVPCSSTSSLTNIPPP